ncbi:MAG: 6-phosphogluconolactonase, partial [Pseudomonadota bacterium]
LAWIRNEVLDAYTRKIKKAGGIDLQIIGVGGRGHVAFHESGIPFKGSKVMLVRLDDNTVANAMADGHFASEKDSPRYAITMGAELVYQAKVVVLLASGERKVSSVAESLLGDPTPDVPISYGQIFAKGGGTLIYVVDRIVGEPLLANRKALKQKGVRIRNLA